MIYLDVLAVPNAQSTKAMGWHESALRIRLAAPPDKGKANDELIRFLSKELTIAKSMITIINGHASRRKRLAISGIDQSVVDRHFPKC